MIKPYKFNPYNNVNFQAPGMRPVTGAAYVASGAAADAAQALSDYGFQRTNADLANKRQLRDFGFQVDGKTGAPVNGPDGQPLMPLSNTRGAYQQIRSNAINQTRSRGFVASGRMRQLAMQPAQQDLAKQVIRTGQNYDNQQFQDRFNVRNALRAGWNNAANYVPANDFYTTPKMA